MKKDVKENLDVLVALANARDTKAIKAFAKKYPKYIAELRSLAIPYRPTEYPTDLPVKLYKLFSLSCALRDAWTGGEDGMRQMEDLLLAPRFELNPAKEVADKFVEEYGFLAINMALMDMDEARKSTATSFAIWELLEIIFELRERGIRPIVNNDQYEAGIREHGLPRAFSDDVYSGA